MAQIYFNNEYFTQGNVKDIANLVKALETDAQIYTRKIETSTDGIKIYYLS